MDASGWVIVITAIFLGVTKLYSMNLEAKERKAASDRDAAKVLRDEAAAAKVAEVKVSLDNATEAVAEHATVQDEVMSHIAKKAESTEEKADRLLEKTTEIHSQTNSQLSKAMNNLEVANVKIDGLEKLLRAMTDGRNPPPQNMAPTKETTAMTDAADATTQAAAATTKAATATTDAATAVKDSLKEVTGIVKQFAPKPSPGKKV